MLVRPVFDHPIRVLTGITDLCGLHQLINEPTRITEKSSTTIDLIFANEPDKIVCSRVSHVGNSDHSLIYAFHSQLVSTRKDTQQSLKETLST